MKQVLLLHLSNATEEVSLVEYLGGVILLIVPGSGQGTFPGYPPPLDVHLGHIVIVDQFPERLVVFHVEGDDCIGDRI